MNGKINMEHRLLDLWNAVLSITAACWAYFQPVHHLIEALLVVMLLNLLGNIAQSIRGWKIRRSRRRRFSVWKWMKEMNLCDILKEFAISCFIVMSLCVIYKILYPIEEDASGLLDITKYIVYFMLIAYFMLFLVRIGEAFPENYIVRVISLFIKKFNIFKYFTFSKDISEDTINDLETMAKDYAGKKK